MSRRTGWLLGFAGSALVHVCAFGVLVAFGLVDRTSGTIGPEPDAVTLGPANPAAAASDPTPAAIPIDVESPMPASDAPGGDPPNLPPLRTVRRRTSPLAIRRAVAPSGSTGGQTGAEPGAADVGPDPEVSPRGDIYGGVARFASGQIFPAGRYRVEYVDGCLKYSGSQGWSLNAYADGHDGWWLVGETTADRIVMLPGTVGFMVGAGGFSTFGACIAANRPRAAVEFNFPGGRLGIWLADEYYDDNLPGEDGRSPSWRLIKLPGE